MNPVHLHTLLTILDEGSFEGAAAILGISPSAVSQRVKALEKDVGRVVLRRTNPVTVTHAGEILAQAARKMELVQAETNARLRSRVERVPLAIAVNADSLSTWFLPVLAKVAQWGNAALQLRREDEAHTLALLRRGDVLGAVTREEAPVSGCDVVELGDMHYVAVATPQLRSTYSTAEGIDWAHMPALGFGPRDGLKNMDLEGRLAPDVPRRRRMNYIPSTEAFVEAARVGLGWALLPDFQAEPLLRARDVVLLDDRVLQVRLYWQRWRLESPLLEDLTAAVVDAAAVLR
ncbi:ArgP/LysG family DNA-binding transcriptional regulator [Corynebacterium uberis]|uniref:ArgP/LysG family DNA-binding transcriptional regulator n=1 Tax=Corynebacterium TaxID=1716 RepID=UPI001D0BDC06|nr:ArgP/LysG family DNA-binding transcriptional regulator [Corynebacterium uberis]MCZ9309097.1 ArgP/LysG family DNA-binding transcriptional regulator [Corynebacterium sp. c6VSa_13]UDL74437.1 ArgP/LysG family DNA-binding transcriptional regulator [Corynebacterium uberis]UDL76728.1 ArgP/LysG family DNA-binding transcriptional regulator [Corynebacterium uberis]UDL78941.1 ArgP/LysG family DNA-binding transcriptional regulator [Corynebacterium uberis]UDL81219.1 ArgP/LysG family DNA-binding transcri